MKYFRSVLLSFILLTLVVSCKKDEPVKAHWYLQSSNLNQNLNSVAITPDNIGIISGDDGMVLRSKTGVSSWISVESGTFVNLTSISFPSSGTGYVAGHYGVFLKTVDGGYSWTAYNLTSYFDFKSVFFTDPDTGYLAADVVNEVTREFESGGYILKTTQGGDGWVPLHTGFFTPLRSIYFTDASEGYAVGESGTIFKTTDGACTWQKLTSGTDKDLNTVIFINKDTGFAAGGDPSGNNGEILKTVDSGQTWTVVSTGTRTVTSLSFLNSRTGYATSSDNNLNGVILKTEDGGSTWTIEDTGLVFPVMNSIFVSDSENVVATGENGAILKWGK